MFDSNAMLELAHIKADRYQRSGGGGAHKIYASSKAYFDAHGYAEMSPFQRACVEMLHRFRQEAELQRENFRSDCLFAKPGFAHDGEVPF